MSTPVLLGHQQPRHLSLPPRVTSAGSEATDLAARAGLFLDPWQSLILDASLGMRADGTWSAFETAVVVSRQNGKGSILEARELAGLFMLGEELILHSAHEFKDLDCDTLVLTPSGWSAMGDLSSGDTVFAPDGQPTKVLTAHPILRDSDCYRVTFADGQSIVAGGGHLWEVTEVSRNGLNPVRRVVTTEQLRRGGLVYHSDCPSRPNGRNTYRWRVDLPKPLQAPDADLPIDPYLLGMWLGDGDSAGGRLTVGGADLDHVLTQLDASGEGWSVGVDKRWPDRVKYVGITGLKARLRGLGVLNNKHIPGLYLGASEKQRRALLAGIMDTDGTVSGHQLAVTMVKHGLMEDALTLVRSLGYRATLRTFRASLNGRDAGPMHRVQFAPTDISPFRMVRKTAKIVRLKTSRSAYNAMVSIDRVPTRPTRCITVAHESGCYLAGRGLTPTHNTAQEAFLRIQWLVENADEFRKRVARIRTSHGDEGIQLRPKETIVTGSSSRQVTIGKAPRLRFVARTGGSGRGFSGDVVILDEAFNLPAQVMSALMFTMSARNDPQLWYASSAVNKDEHPNGEVLSAVRDRGLAGDDPSLVYAEWSADEEAYKKNPEAVSGDPEQWAAANPGLGIRISPEHVMRERRSMGAKSKTFAVERLGIGDWPVVTEHMTVFDAAIWAALTDLQSAIEGDVVFAADATPNRAAGAIAVAGKRSDGLLHGEIVEHRPGTGWMLDRLIELHKSWGPRAVVLNPGSAAGSLSVGLREAGIEPVEVSGRGEAQACGWIYDLITNSGVRHLGQPELAAALAAAQKRDMGDAWVWDRKDSNGDISPLGAFTLALNGFAQPAEPEQPFFASWT